MGNITPHHLGAAGRPAPLWGDQERPLTRYRWQPGNRAPGAEPRTEDPGGLWADQTDRLSGRASQGRVQLDLPGPEPVAHPDADGRVGQAAPDRRFCPRTERVVMSQ